MIINICNCNNIDNGSIEVQEKKLNILYGINGTGKTTIAKAIQHFYSDKDYSSLIQFKNRKTNKQLPTVDLVDEKGLNVAIYNEDYVNTNLYKADELISNSFEIIVRTPNYEKNLLKIELMVSNLKSVFEKHEDLNDLISVLTTFLNSFGKSIKSPYAASSAFAKGLSKGNLIENIPEEFQEYTPFLKNEKNYSYIGWQAKGQDFLDITDNKCPCCTSVIEEKGKQIIKQFCRQYNSKEIEHLNNVMDTFEKLKSFFSSNAVSLFSAILNNTSGISDSQNSFIMELKQQATDFLMLLIKMKSIGFDQLKDSEDIEQQLKAYQIQLEYFSHFNSPVTAEKVNLINQSLDEVIIKAGELKGAVNTQKQYLATLIENNKKQINGFLKSAGYHYTVDIKNSDATGKTKLMLIADGMAEELERPNEHLSFGEKNALSLILFILQVKHEKNDLIILDDPISSFDGNKRFALVNLLFMGETSLKGLTVLLLTHDFSTVVDLVKNMQRALSISVSAAFLSNNRGALAVKKITSSDIVSYKEILLQKIKDTNALLVTRIIALRRLSEIENGKDLVWNYISSLIHNKKPCVNESNMDAAGLPPKSEREMTSVEIGKSLCFVKKYIPEFDENQIQKLIADKTRLKQSFFSLECPYEKLQIFRIIIGDGNESDSIVQKFINETFHVENDSIFQLDYAEYDTVPSYIIDACQICLEESN